MALTVLQDSPDVPKQVRSAISFEDRVAALGGENGVLANLGIGGHGSRSFPVNPGGVGEIFWAILSAG